MGGERRKSEIEMSGPPPPPASIENRIDEGPQKGFRRTALHEIAATLLGVRVDAEHRIPEVYLPQARRPIHLGNP